MPRTLLFCLSCWITTLGFAQSGTFDLETASISGVPQVVTQTVSGVTLTVSAPVSVNRLNAGGTAGTSGNVAETSTATTSFTLGFSHNVNISSVRVGLPDLLVVQNCDVTFTPNTGSAVTVNAVPGSNNTAVGGATATLNMTGVNSITATLASCSHGATSVQFMVDNVVMDGSLPVELIDFSVTSAGAEAHLVWQTASETNNAGFHIEHTTAEGRWVPLGFVEGQGTTLDAQRYVYTAEGLAPGPHRFRLRQVDYGGAFAYSPEVEVQVEMAEAFSLSEVYPNPFNPEARVTLSVREGQHVAVTVHNLLGREVARLYDGAMTAQHAQVLRLDGRGWPSGVYVVRVVGERFRASQTVTLMK